MLAALTLAAAVLPADHTDLVHRQWWFVAALAFSLVGDVLLMLPKDLFVAGLSAFLAGHVLFIVGLLQPPSPPGVPPFAFSTTGLVVAAIVVAVARRGAGLPHLPVAGPRRASGRSSPRSPSTWSPSGPWPCWRRTSASRRPLAGAALFVVSDTVLALNRFVRPLGHGDVVVHVTYHLAQGLLVLSLLS